MDERHAELGAFLRSRRARLRPEDVGLTDYGGARRVPGLRREELAEVAGVSAGYYTRLEQGAGPGVSGSVLDALARALRLDAVERAHLHTLAGHGPGEGPGSRPRDGAAARASAPVSARAPAERLRPAVRMMIDALGPVPALVLGRHSDILGWNRTAHALLAPHLAFDAPRAGDGDGAGGGTETGMGRDGRRPNIARMMFRDPWLRELYVDWPRKARDTVADLRLSAGRFPGDPGLTALVAELDAHCPLFAALWASRTVLSCAHHTRELRHPATGPLTLTTELMDLPDDAGQRVAVLAPEPGSRSAEALRLLAASPAGTY